MSATIARMGIIVAVFFVLKFEGAPLYFATALALVVSYMAIPTRPVE